MAWIEKRAVVKNGKKTKDVRWYVADRDPHTRKRLSWPGGPSKETAKIVRNDVERKLINKEWGQTDASMTVAKLLPLYIEYSEAEKKRPKTIQNINYGVPNLSQFVGDKRLSDISKTDMERFKADLLGKRSKNGTINILRTCKAFFGYAVQMGYLRSNPAMGILRKFKPEKVARFLGLEEIKALTQACRFNPELLKIMAVAVQTGMRKGEILSAKGEDLQNNRLGINKTKTGYERMVPIHETIQPIFQEVTLGPVFKGWDEDRLNRAWQRAVRRAKIGRVRFHDLRHTFCSNYLQNGGTIADLMHISGHRSLSSLQRYTHFQNNYLDSKINSMKPMVQLPQLVVIK